MIQQMRKIDLKELFRYLLGSVPWSLVSVTSGMVKTNTLTLMLQKLERGITLADAI